MKGTGIAMACRKRVGSNPRKRLSITFCENVLEERGRQ